MHTGYVHAGTFVHSLKPHTYTYTHTHMHTHTHTHTHTPRIHTHHAYTHNTHIHTQHTQHTHTHTHTHKHTHHTHTHATHTHAHTQAGSSDPRPQDLGQQPLVVAANKYAVVVWRVSALHAAMARGELLPEGIPVLTGILPSCVVCVCVCVCVYVCGDRFNAFVCRVCAGMLQAVACRCIFKLRMEFRNFGITYTHTRTHAHTCTHMHTHTHQGVVQGIYCTCLYLPKATLCITWSICSKQPLVYLPKATLCNPWSICPKQPLVYLSKATLCITWSLSSHNTALRTHLHCIWSPKVASACAHTQQQTLPAQHPRLHSMHAA